MTQEKAAIEAEKLLGKDFFAECDCQFGERLMMNRRYYVGTRPKTPGPYHAYMGFSWEEALQYAKMGPA